MQPCLAEPQRTMASLLKAIEAEASISTPPNDDQRSERRKPLHLGCDLCLFDAIGEPILTNEAVVRNITFMGVSVVAPIQEAVGKGRPAEVAIMSPSHTHTHLAGTIAFCRRVDSTCHELGITVHAAGSAPIVMHDVEFAKIIYYWFTRGLKLPA